MLDELVPSALHTVEQHANNPVEADHGRLKARLRPMRYRSARIIAAGHALVRNLRRGHYDIATESPQLSPAPHRVRRTRTRYLSQRGIAIHAAAYAKKAQRNSAPRVPKMFWKPAGAIWDVSAAPVRS